MQNNYYDICRDEIKELLPSQFESVLDIGCGVGSTSQWLKSRYPGIKTFGVEINPLAASAASGVMNNVIIANIDNELDRIMEYKNIDLILALDVIEHLNDPWSFITKISTILSNNGIIIASIPNVRNIKVLWPLLIHGEWSYGQSGILDVTHLRFFTKKEIVKIFESSGYEIKSILTTGPLLYKNAITKSGKLAFFINKLAFGLLTEFFAHQFVLSVKKRKS